MKLVIEFMVVCQTSLEAFTKMQKSNKLGINEKIVYEVFSNRPWGYTNFQVSEILGWPINRVTGRTNSLVRRGLLVRAGVTVNFVTGMKNIVWAVPELIRRT